MDRRFVPSGIVLFRTPLLPFEQIVAESNGTTAKPLRRLEHRLAELLSRPEIREALLLSSPALLEAFSEMAPQPDRPRRIERAIARYLYRMSGRPTPFGLMAGCSTGKVGKETRLILEDLSATRCAARYDLGLLITLCQYLTQDSRVQRTLCFRPNSSLYEIPGQIRYLRSTTGPQGYQAVEIEKTDYLQATLSRAAAGATADALARPLVDPAVGIALEEAQGYVRQLIQDEVLVAELGPVLSDPAPIHSLLEELERVSRDREGGALGVVIQRLRAGQALVERICTGAPGTHFESVREFHLLLEGLPVKPDRGQGLQVDLFKPACQATLGKNVIAELLRGVTLLHRLKRYPQSREADLLHFRQGFEERFGGREIPLLEALDEDTGLGYPVGISGGKPVLLGNLDFPAKTAAEIPWSDAESHLLRLLTQALRSDAMEIELASDDLSRLTTARPDAPLPDALAVFGTLAAQSEEAVQRGDFQVLIHSISGPSGVRLLSRFCHLDPTLRQGVVDHVRLEEALDPEAIFAEVIHLPVKSLGNVLLHPPWRHYEIPYLGRATVPREYQIPVQDLRVTVRDGRIVLLSARLGRRVRPRLSHAHAFQRSPVTVYRFLADLQAEGEVDSLRWNWGALIHSAFLPRIRCGRVVLERARWHLPGESLRVLDGLAGDALLEAAENWRRQMRLPRLVYLLNVDEQELLIDFEEPLSVENLRQIGRSEKVFRLVEMFPTPDQLLARGPEGRFVHEFVVPFVAVRADRPKERTRPARVSPSRRTLPLRRFPPGSEWLYVKLYTGQASADALLVDLVRPLIEDACQQGVADRWFFIRYADPHWHLRLRLHGDPEKLWAWFRTDFWRLLEEARYAGRLWRTCLDTYEREMDRYGGPLAIERAEAIFQADSELILRLLEQPDQSMAEGNRWRLAMAGSYGLLDDFGLEPAEKISLFERWAAELRREFGVDKRFRLSVASLYRELQPEFPGLLASNGLSATERELIAQRSRQIIPAVITLRSLAAEGRLDRSIPQMAMSFIHMHVNRMVQGDARRQELVLYDFLARHCRSSLAKRKGDS